ncbi:MAG: OsmC family protein [Actinobacteria bacterium]|nr:OsmC family protein [Actinomycetota bacterium]
MVPQRKATAEWRGDLKSGRGSMQFADYDGPYTFASRFESGEGTNPEELLGAAHAGCFSMALSNMLAQAGHTPKQVSTTASVSLEVGADGAAIAEIVLTCRADVPGISDEEFARIAGEAKTGCPVSKALAATPIALDAALV